MANGFPARILRIQWRRTFECRAGLRARWNGPAISQAVAASDPRDASCFTVDSCSPGRRGPNARCARRQLGGQVVL